MDFPANDFMTVARGRSVRQISASGIIPVGGLAAYRACRGAGWHPPPGPYLLVSKNLYQISGNTISERLKEKTRD